MNEINNILIRITKIIQTIILLGSVMSLIYLGILFYFKKFDEVKKFLPWIIVGLILLFSAYVIPVIILSFIEVSPK